MASYADMEVKECASCEHEFFCDPNSGAVHCNDCYETAYAAGRNAAWANYCPNDGQPLDVETLARAYCSPYQPRAYALAWAEGYRAQALMEESRYHATVEV